MSKFLKPFANLVIFLFCLSIFGWMSSKISSGEKEFGFLTGAVKQLYSFPDLFSRAVEDLQTLPETFVPTPEGFEPVNRLDSSMVILTTYSETDSRRAIILYDLKSDSVLYKWSVKNPHQPHDRIINPLLFPDKNLVYCITRKGLRRIDSTGKVLWKQDKIWGHHGMNLDKDGNIWTCSFEPVYFPTGLYHLRGKPVYFKDNYISRLDAETGEILSHISITHILEENDLSAYLLKSPHIWDPIHINDVQPALKTTEFYQEGDLFLSARHPSFVLHYRPSTNEVLKVIEGPFVSQHDVDFLNDSTLVFFNNNYYVVANEDEREPPRDTSRLEYAGSLYSNIIRYDLWNDSISFIGDSVFRANEIFTYTEGLQEFTSPGTYFVEEQNVGVLWVIENDRVIYKNVLNSQHEGYHHLANWARIIEDYD